MLDSVNLKILSSEITIYGEADYIGEHSLFKIDNLSRI